MTAYQYKLLDKNEQTEAAWALGMHVATRTTATHKILLWLLEDFYVEMFYNYIDDEIDKIKTFKNPDLLYPYFDQMDISDLFQ